MSTSSLPTPTAMGKVVTRLTVVNVLDQARAESGEISPQAVRSVALDDALVDSGATTLCLPAAIIAHLGLRLRRVVSISTADGQRTAHLFRDAEVTVEGRSGTFDCLERDSGRPTLLGVIPLEALGIELDLHNQRLRLLPEGPNDTYYTVL